MIARMSRPMAKTPKTAAGSVGTVDTQFLDLPHPIALDCGRTLHPIRIAYETYGTLSPSRDNEPYATQ
jgi:homoserine O-acetyltransferase